MYKSHVFSDSTISSDDEVYLTAAEDHEDKTRDAGRYNSPRKKPRLGVSAISEPVVSLADNSATSTSKTGKAKQFFSHDADDYLPCSQARKYWLDSQPFFSNEEGSADSSPSQSRRSDIFGVYPGAECSCERRERKRKVLCKPI